MPEICGSTRNCGQITRLDHGIITPEVRTIARSEVRGIYPYCDGIHKRDDPRQGGEEAEVVVYQPRGVELMHTRHKPSLPTIHTSQQASASIEGPGNWAGTGQNSRRNHLS